MKKFSIATSILGVLFFFLGCEGSFDPSDLPTEPDFQIDLIAPPNQQQCLTEGDDGNGNWRVQFNWSVTPEFDGDFNILLTANGAAEDTRNLNPGDELILSANTLYTWQIQADGREESEISTFVTPASPGEPTSPPVISTITVEPVGTGHRISCTVLDDDLNEVRLFVDDNPVGGPITQQGDLEWEVNNLSPNVEIRVIATDNSGHSTEQIRRFVN